MSLSGKKKILSFLFGTYAAVTGFDVLRAPSVQTTEDPQTHIKKSVPVSKTFDLASDFFSLSIISGLGLLVRKKEKDAPAALSAKPQL